MKNHIFIFLLLSFFASCSTEQIYRTPSSKTKKILFIFVHGFGGDKMIAESIDRAKAEKKNIYRAAFGEFNAIYDELKTLEKSSPDKFYYGAFKYNTRMYSNIPASRVFNLMLLGENTFEEEFPHNNILPISPHDADEIVFITLSNGNLVVREAILEANGLKDEKNIHYESVLKNSPKPKNISMDLFLDIKKDEELLRIFKKSVVHDASPILGGAADARGTPKLAARFAEINPFGNHMEWVFSSKNVSLVNKILKDRYTYLICGDFYTRGVWNFMSHVDRHPKWEPLLYLSNFATGKRWYKGNVNWFFNYERAKGKDQDHHIEYVSGFKGDNFCTFDDYIENNNKVITSLMKKAKKLDDPYLMQKLEDRFKNLENGDRAYAKIMSSELTDYAFEKLDEIHVPGSKYNNELMEGFFDLESKKQKVDDKMELLERHTVIVFYRPFIKQLILNMKLD